MKVSNVTIPRRKTHYNPRNEIYNNGQDNAFPTLVELLINSSTTAFACANVLASSIEGQGFRHMDMQMTINNKGETLGILLAKVCKEIAYHRGVFLQVNYNALYQVVSLQVVPFKYCRLGKLDDLNFRGKVAVYDNWDYENGPFKKDNIQWLPLFNPSAKVIEKQVEKAQGWQNYTGQILYLNLDYNDTYPQPFIYPVMNDCESEYYSSIFSNKIFKKGFIGQFLMATKPMKDQTEREEFREMMKKSTGVESDTALIHIELDLESEEPQKEYQITPITNNTNDRIFEYTDKKISNNIRRAFSNVPVVLIDAIEGKIGATSGEAYKEAQTELLYIPPEYNPIP